MPHCVSPKCTSFTVANRQSSSPRGRGRVRTTVDPIGECERDDVPATRIPVDYASHSVHVEELRETLRESLSGLQPRASDIVFISAVTGAGLDTSILDGDYWFANLRQPAGAQLFINCFEHVLGNLTEVAA